jgi:riboflavin kinase/FMN adenylyltransferase
MKLSRDCYTIADGTYWLEALVEGKHYYGIGVYLQSQELFEAHFFNFSGDIYGEIIAITPLFQIRENQKFSGIDALKAQIEKDKKVMEKWIKENES